MKSRVFLAVVSLACLAAAGAQAETLLWDNYAGGIDALPNNGAINMSSERNTQVVESTWVVDDAILNASPQQDVLLTRLNWYGARDAAYDPYASADVIFLDRSFNILLELDDLSFNIVQERDYLDPFSRLYEGQVDFDVPVSVMNDLGTNSFYVGVRLVGSQHLQGRNHFVVSSSDSTLFGDTEGYIKAAVFGAPDWRPASDVWYGAPTPNINFEFAFQLYGDIVPEPTSIGLLLIGAAALLRRR